MKVTKLPSGMYRIQKMYKGKRFDILFDHEPKQREIERAVNDRIKEINPYAAGTFAKHAAEYIENRQNVVSPATVRTYNVKLRQISQDFKNKEINSIDNNDVQIEINRFAVDHAPKTVKSLHGFISSVLGAYRPNLRLKTKLPQAVRKDEYEPSTDDIKRILDDVKGTPYHVAFLLGVLGLRRGEICACSLNDLDGNELWIHRSKVYTGTEWVIKNSPKTDASNRKIELPAALADEIRMQGFIFNGHPNALNKAIHRAQKRLDIPQFKFHKLRSYFASYASSMNIPESDILAIGGWATPSIMRSVYRKSLEKSKNESLKKITDGLM